MIDIEFRIGGRKVSFDKGRDETEAKVLTEIRTAATAAMRLTTLAIIGLSVIGEVHLISTTVPRRKIRTRC